MTKTALSLLLGELMEPEILGLVKRRMDGKKERYFQALHIAEAEAAEEARTRRDAVACDRKWS